MSRGVSVYYLSFIGVVIVPTHGDGQDELTYQFGLPVYRL